MHVTKVAGISALIPAFKSKTVGKYMYPSKRVFFTVNKKDIDRSKAGLEGKEKLHRYTPKEKIDTVWIDQSYKSYKIGAVYVDTSHPIPVDEIK